MTQILIPFQLELANSLEMEILSEEEDKKDEILDEIVEQLQFAQTISPGLLLPENYELLRPYFNDKEFDKVLHYISHLCLYENSCAHQHIPNAGWVCYGYKYKEKLFGRLDYRVIISMLSDIGFTNHIKAVRGAENRAKNHKRMDRLGWLFRSEKRVIVPFPNSVIKKKHFVEKKPIKRINRNDVAYRIEKHIKSLNIVSTNGHLPYILSIQNGGKLMHEWRVLNDILRCNIHLTQDKYAGRIYHPLMAGREARNFILVNGQSPVEADIKGSHTFIYHMLLVNDGNIGDMEIKGRLEYLLSDKQKERVKQIMDGDIYTMIANYHNMHYPNLVNIDRAGGKIIFQKALSGACRLSSKILRNIYGFKLPKFIVDKNLKDRQKSSYVLANIERELVFKAWDMFNSQYPNVPCIPRHDSLSTFSSHIGEVRKCLKTVFKEAFNSLPKLKTEPWHYSGKAMAIFGAYYT